MPQYIYFLTTKYFVDLSNILDRIQVFNALITELESFIDFYFEGERYALHWGLDQWILTIFDELCIYLEANL